MDKNKQKKLRNVLVHVILPLEKSDNLSQRLVLSPPLCRRNSKTIREYFCRIVILSGRSKEGPPPPGTEEHYPGLMEERDPAIPVIMPLIKFISNRLFPCPELLYLLLYSRHR